MKFDPEIIITEFERLRSRYTFTKDPETGEITAEGDFLELRRRSWKNLSIAAIITIE
jgi:hypothetical protein